MSVRSIFFKRVYKGGDRISPFILLLYFLTWVGCQISTKDEPLKDVSMRIVSLNDDGSAWVECGNNSYLDQFQRGNVLVVIEREMSQTKAILLVKSVQKMNQAKNWSMVQALQNRKSEKGLDCQIINSKGERYKPVPTSVEIKKGQDRLDYINSVTDLPNNETISIGDQVEYHSKTFNQKDFKIWF